MGTVLLTLSANEDKTTVIILRLNQHYVHANLMLIHPPRSDVPMKHHTPKQGQISVLFCNYFQIVHSTVIKTYVALVFHKTDFDAY